jgi:hypothetical protein
VGTLIEYDRVHDAEGDATLRAISGAGISSPQRDPGAASPRR